MVAKDQKSRDVNQNGLKSPNQNLDQNLDFSKNSTVQKSDDHNVLRGPEQPPIEGLRSIGEQIFDKMLQYGDNIALLDADTNVAQTFRALLKRSAAIALALRHMGLSPTTDVISLVEMTSQDSFAVVLGALFAGSSINMLDGQWTVANTVPTLLPRLKPRVIFCHAKVLDKLQKVLDDFSEILKDSEVIVYGTIGEENNQNGCKIENRYCYKTLDEFVASCSEEANENFRPTVIKDLDNTPALILCTSGSTGVPKGVMLQHRHLATMMVVAGKRFPSSFTNFTNSPCYWSTGIFMLLIGLYCGNKKIYTKKTFDEANVLGLVQKYQVNTLFLSSFQVSLLNQFSDIDKYDLTSVYIIFCGGSRLSQTHLDQMQARLKQGIVSLGYGMTEMTGGCGLNPQDEMKPGSVGKPGAGISLKIVDPDTGANLGPDQDGDIYLRGPTMIGYHGDQEATRAVLDPVQGWLKTGDIGHYDQDGYVYVTDRSKEIAKYRGAYINPSDIEDVLSCHPSVRSSAVVSVSHDDTCDLMVAYVELKTDRNETEAITSDELEEYVNGKMEDFQKLRGGLYILDKLPILTHGKVARPAVKQIANEMKTKIIEHYQTKYKK